MGKVSKILLFLFLAGLTGIFQKAEAQKFSPVTDVSNSLKFNTNQYQTYQYHERSNLVKPQNIYLRPTDDPGYITVKFRDEIQITISLDNIPLDRSQKYLRTGQSVNLFNKINNAGGYWRRMAGASEDEIDRLHREAELNLNRKIANLNNYLILKVPDGVSSEEWINELNTLPEIELALPMPKPVPLPLTAKYDTLQGYLNRADTGIAARYAWSISDSGQNVAICDFEYSWNLSHQDIPAGITKLIPPQYSSGWYDYDLYNDDNHGTAVLGEMVSKKNAYGTTGAVYGATVKVAPTFFKNISGTDSVWDLGAAMTYAMTQVNRGDVFLIEQQYPGPLYLGIYGNDTGLVPIEWYPPWYDVVVTAVGNGIHVVEAAGNGYQNLDSIVYRQGNYGHWPFLPEANSGAIIVGAGAVHSHFGGTDIARSRLSFSNYGSRLDMQGWGEQVMTTGYGTYYSSEGKNLYYRRDFNGTSSASPVVASAVALVESRFESLYGTEMAPQTMRSILVSTGQAQQSGSYPSSQKIGPLPNVQSAVNFASNTLAGGTYTVGASGNYLNLTAVSKELKSKILTGNVIFELLSDYNGVHTETLPLDFTEFTTSGGNWTVIIRPAFGVTGRMTIGKPPGYYPLIRLNGIDRITFDGRPGGVGTTSEWLVRNSRMDSLAPAILFTNGANDNIISYLQIESENNFTNSGTVMFGTGIDVVGNKRNEVSHCVISGRTDGGGLHANGFYSEMLANDSNDSNKITANEVVNWTNSAISLHGEKWRVDSNSIYHTVSLVTNLSTIEIFNGNGHHVGYNYIGGSTIGAGGAPFVYAGSNFIGIQLWVDTVITTSVQGNQIKNLTMANPSPGQFIGIQVLTGRVDIGTITGNIIGDPSVSGSIQVFSSGVIGGININNISVSAVVNVFNNKISNIIQTGPPPGPAFGIRMLNIRNQNAERNEIKNIGPVTPMAANYVYGIYIVDVLVETTRVVNNMISLGTGMNNSCTYIGIYDADPTLSYTFIYNNSVHIGGLSNGSDSSYAYRRDGVSLINLFNNIFSNERSGGSGVHYAIANKVHPVNFFPGSSDYNIFYNLKSSQLTYWPPGITQPLIGWRAVTMCDFNSINQNPQYNNTIISDLHINPNIYSPADNAGFSLSMVGVDFDGQLRGASPDIGADEYTINAPQSFVLLSPGDGSSERPITDTLLWQKSPAAGKYDVYLDTLSPPSILVSSGMMDTFFVYTNLDSNRTYYWSVVGKNSSGNTNATGSPWWFKTVTSGQNMISISIADGWNMVSVPLIVDDYAKSTLFPNALSDAFIYTGSYVSQNNLENGAGYWLKFSGSQSANIVGSLDEEDTVDLNSGWNMIGSISSTVKTDSIENIPGDMVLSGYFAYNGAYVEVDSITPGYAYWVKSNKSGQLLLKKHSGTVLSKNISAASIINGLASLNIYNTSGKTRKLYFGENQLILYNPVFFELPPKPPSGGFDVRFESGRYIEFYDGKDEREIQIIISSGLYPVMIEWDIPVNFVGKPILEVNGVNYKLEDKGLIKIPDENYSVKLLLNRLKNAGIPAEFSLKKNYPNPFNPVTKIDYQLPAERYVVIKIYNMLGQEIALLVDDYKEAGYHTIEWDARDIPSGIYYCKMSTNDFSATIKLILLR